MSDPRPDDAASIDQWIDWVTRQRAIHPHTPLSQLLERFSTTKRPAESGSTGLPKHILLELACIDLIVARRHGAEVTAETYLHDFPMLGEPESILDLIDAEICIRKELHQPIDGQHWVTQFPELAGPIRELIELDQDAIPSDANVPIDSLRVRSLHDVTPVESNHPSQRESIQTSQAHGRGRHDAWVTVAEGVGTVEPQQTAYDSVREDEATKQPDALLGDVTSVPMPLPQGFVAERCIVASSDRWLIRGRDGKRGYPLAFKIVRLMDRITPSQADRILDACEGVAKVQNPRWIAPTVAAIQQQFIGVIRPWCFGRQWMEDDRLCEYLRHVSEVALALESAHRSGAAHGGVHPGNLVVDHDGRVRVMDAMCNRSALRAWLKGLRIGSGDAKEMILRMRFADATAITQLVASASQRWPDRRLDHWVHELEKGIHAMNHRANQDIGLCEWIAERLSEYAEAAESDAPPPSLSPWAQRWRRWFASK